MTNVATIPCPAPLPTTLPTPLPAMYASDGRLSPVWAGLTPTQRSLALGYRPIPLLTWAANARCPVNYATSIIMDAVTGQYHVYYPLAPVARLVQMALVERWPAQPFRVLCHPARRGNATVGSISVRWTGGPSEDAVWACVGMFVGVTRDPHKPTTGAYTERLTLLDGYQSHFGVTAIKLVRASVQGRIA